MKHTMMKKGAAVLLSLTLLCTIGTAVFAATTADAAQTTAAAAENETKQHKQPPTNADGTKKTPPTNADGTTPQKEKKQKSDAAADAQADATTAAAQQDEATQQKQKDAESTTAAQTEDTTGGEANAAAAAEAPPADAPDVSDPQAVGETQSTGTVPFVWYLITGICAVAAAGAVIYLITHRKK